MAINGVLGTYERPRYDWGVVVRGTGEVVLPRRFRADLGKLSLGLIVSLDANGDLVPFERTALTLGTGDGTTTSFSGTLAIAPLAPGSVQVTDGTQVLRDDGHGNLYGDGSGTVNYATGEVSATFNSAPASGASVDASAAREPVGVLNEDLDTAQGEVGQVVVHGGVEITKLHVNGTSPSEDDLRLLERKHIFPMTKTF